MARGTVVDGVALCSAAGVVPCDGCEPWCLATAAHHGGLGRDGGVMLLSDGHSAGHR